MKTRQQPLIAAVFALLAHPALAEARIIEREALIPPLEGRNSDFLAVDLSDGTRCELSGSDLTSRHAPWSSFKIPNFVIALETGATTDPQQWRDWDPVARPPARYWPDAWRQGQTLETAFQRSAAWYFQEVAQEISGRQYREILSDWNYGNANAPDGDDGFWLGGPLAISVEEQVKFVSALLTGGLDVDPTTIDALTTASEDGTFDNGVLHGKTGAGPVEAGNFAGAFEGWYVGWLARQGQAPVVLAHYVRAQAFSDLRTFRRDRSVILLEACGF